MDGRIKIRNGINMFRRARRVRKNGFKKYKGSTEEICRKILDDAFDGKCFRASSGHFRQFWVRDFALSCESLIDLGYKDEVRKSLEYALRVFISKNRVSQVVTEKDEPFDFPCYAPDSLALFLYAITHTNNKDLAKKHKRFLQEQTDIFAKKVLDHTTGLPRRNTRFSSIRDHVKRDASCYDMVMIAITAREAEALGLAFPVSFEEAQKNLRDAYWNGTYFFSDLKKQNIVAGDANVFPFWSGIITDKMMLRESMDAVHAAGLDKPFPLRYVNSHDAKRERIGLHIANLFAKDYETDSVWMHLGLAYMRVLVDVDRKLVERQLEAYARLIKSYETFLEVFDTNGSPFKRFFYVSDEAMVWCANYLTLVHTVSNPSVLKNL